MGPREHVDRDPTSLYSESMEQGMNKTGAVRCPDCESCNVEMVKQADSTDAAGTQSREETYECQECDRRFAKHV